jgi:hypothetical protein
LKSFVFRNDLFLFYISGLQCLLNGPQSMNIIPTHLKKKKKKKEEGRRCRQAGAIVCGGPWMGAAPGLFMQRYAAAVAHLCWAAQVATTHHQLQSL